VPIEAPRCAPCACAPAAAPWWKSYDDALLAGHGAYLLDMERQDILAISAGNLSPGQEARTAARLVALFFAQTDASARAIEGVSLVMSRHAPRRVHPLSEPHREEAFTLTGSAPGDKIKDKNGECMKTFNAFIE
jgi:hypothetical protein